MSAAASDVVIAGVGMHPFGRFEGVSTTDMGVVAVRAALDEAGIGKGGFQAAQHLVAGGNAAVNRPAERRLESTLSDARLVQGGTDGYYAHVGGGDAVEAPEGMHPHTSDGDLGSRGAHEASTGAKAYVTTSFPSASRWRGTTRSSIARPGSKAPGSLSVRRVMTRTPSGSSTTPIPKGTSPS